VTTIASMTALRSLASASVAFREHGCGIAHLTHGRGYLTDSMDGPSTRDVLKHIPFQAVSSPERERNIVCHQAFRDTKDGEARWWEDQA
jgi:hypothetical protein